MYLQQLDAWVWAHNDEAIVNMRWARLQPDYGYEECLEIRLGTRLWNNVECHKKRAFICESTGTNELC